MLTVQNRSKQATIVSGGRVADSFLTRLKGLTGVRTLEAGDGLLITPCNSIHTHFMAIPIDVLYVDEQDRVVDLDKAMRPWQIGRRRPAAKYVIELPAGTIERQRIAVGDQLDVKH